MCGNVTSLRSGELAPVTYNNDIYSASCVFWYLATGNAPPFTHSFHHKTKLPSFFRWHLLEHPDLPPDILTELVNILQRTLLFREGERISAQNAAEDLNNLMDYFP
jgi:serine/threonine protein kinase